MKKFIQSILCGYRENKEAKKVGKCTFNTSFEGGSPQDKFNAMLSLKKEVLKRKYRDWNIEQKEVIN